MPTHASTRTDGSSLDIRRVDIVDNMPDAVDVGSLTDFLHRSLAPWEDTPRDIRRGIDYALSTERGLGGFLLLGFLEHRLAGAVVVLDTGMGGYVPRFLLLFVAVDPDYRSRGIGGRLVKRTIRETEGDLALHVEYENPAKRLYERVGFRSDYAEMRYKP